MGSNSSMITVLFRKFNPPRNGSLLGNFGNRLEWVALNNREMGIYIYIHTDTRYKSGNSGNKQFAWRMIVSTCGCTSNES